MAKKKTTKKRPVTKKAKAKRPKSKTAARKTARPTTKRKKTVKKSVAKPAKKSAAKKTPKRAAVKSKKSAKKLAPKRVKQAKAQAARSRTTPVPKAAKPASVRKLKSRLSPGDVDDFRILLLQKRHELVGDMTTLTEEALHKNSHEVSGNLSNMPQHMAELGSDNYEQEFALILVDGERALLNEIDGALQRIANGGFGICEATGKPIGKARLRAKPWAKYCYEYVLAQETGQIGRY